MVEGDLEGAGADLPHSGITQEGTSGPWKRKRADVHSDEHIKVPKVITNGVLTTASGQDTNGNQSRLDQWLDCIQGPDCPQEAQIGRHAKGCSAAMVDKIIQTLRGNTAIHALYFQGMGITDDQLIALLEVLQSTRVYALNLGETMLTLRGLQSVLRLLPSTTITALYLDYTPHRQLRQSIRIACRSNCAQRDALYAATGDRVRAWHHIPEDRPQPTRSGKGSVRKLKPRTSTVMHAKDMAKGNGEKCAAELGVKGATRPCHCCVLPCRCIFTTKLISTIALGTPDNGTSIVSTNTVAKQYDKDTSSFDVVQQILAVNDARERSHKRTREARGWDTRALAGSNKKQAIEIGDSDSLDVELGRRTRLRDSEAGAEMDATQEAGRQE